MSQLAVVFVDQYKSCKYINNVIYILSHLICKITFLPVYGLVSFLLQIQKESEGCQELSFAIYPFKK